MDDALQTVHLAKTVNEPMTGYQKANEDRLNENFRMLQDKLESLRKEIERLQAGS